MESTWYRQVAHGAVAVCSSPVQQHLCPLWEAAPAQMTLAVKLHRTLWQGQPQGPRLCSIPWPGAICQPGTRTSSPVVREQLFRARAGWDNKGEMYKASGGNILSSLHTLKCLAVCFSHKRKTQTQPCLRVESSVENTPGAKYGLGHEICGSIPTQDRSTGRLVTAEHLSPDWHWNSSVWVTSLSISYNGPKYLHH